MLDERIEAIPENILHAGADSERFGKELFENADDVIDNQAVEVVARRIEQVEWNGACGVLRVEIDHVAGARARDVVVQDVVDELAMGVDDRGASASRYVPRNHIAQKGAFAGTRCTKYGSMLATGLWRYEKNAWLVLIPVFISRADRHMVEHKWTTIEL